MQNTIFVSVAAYRDPQLEPTLTDCIKKAAYPDRLRFGVCWQRDETDSPLALFEDPRFRLLDVNWRQSKGACWARAEIMKLWQGEDWYLQVDSHCRFVQGWDTKLLRMMAETGSQQPILSTYASPFTPGPNEVLREDPLQMAFQAFTPEGIPQLKPAPLQKHRTSSGPVHARFIAAGFLFTEGRFVEKVPYDPELYFMGEESAMTIRAFTHGYDLFHPAETLVWHDYIRADARKHWGDHTETTSVASRWSDLDEVSRRKVQRLLRGEPVFNFGLGKVRTLADYEAYAGLSLSAKKAQLYTVRAQEPPNPACSPDWPDSVYPWIARVRFDRAELPIGSLDDPDLWSLSIQDEEGFDIHRRDLIPEELVPFAGQENELALICEFQSETIPARWCIWPLSRTKGWMHKLQGAFREGDFAIIKDNEPAETNG